MLTAIFWLNCMRRRVFIATSLTSTRHKLVISERPSRTEIKSKRHCFQKMSLKKGMLCSISLKSKKKKKTTTATKHNGWTLNNHSWPIQTAWWFLYLCICIFLNISGHHSHFQSVKYWGFVLESQQPIAPAFGDLVIILENHLSFW